jgi:hypothetical protein
VWVLSGMAERIPANEKGEQCLSACADIVDPTILRYVDYICSEEMMAPVLQQVQEIIGIPILHIPVPSDRSGPKFDQIHDVFSENYANIGRI